MEVITFNLSYFIVRLCIGVVSTSILLALLKPSNRHSHCLLAFLFNVPAIFAIGVSKNNSLACCAAGWACTAILICYGCFFARFEAERANQTAVENEEGK